MSKSQVMAFKNTLRALPAILHFYDVTLDEVKRENKSDTDLACECRKVIMYVAIKNGLCSRTAGLLVDRARQSAERITSNIDYKRKRDDEFNDWLKEVLR